MASAHAAGLPSVDPTVPDARLDVVNTNCAGLQAALNASTQNTFIVLDSSDGAGAAGRKLCNSAYTARSNPPAAPGTAANSGPYLVGHPNDGNVDGFNGFDLGTRPLTGVDAGHFTFWALVAEQGTVSGNGGALSFTGETQLTVFDSEFVRNSAGGRGGAIYVNDGTSATAGGNSFQGNLFGSETSSTQGNSAGTGGAVAVQSGKANVGSSGAGGNVFGHNSAIQNGGALDWDLTTGQNTGFDGNTYVHNTAGGSGGGAHVISPGGFLTFGNETFVNNSLDQVTGGPTGAHRGGGLFVERSSNSAFELTSNVFRENVIGPFESGDLTGGGLAITGSGINVTSRLNKWLSNTIVQAATEFDTEGGGMALIGSGSKFTGFLDVFAGNLAGSEIVGEQVGGQNGEGGGIYVGGEARNTLELSDTTVAGNRVGPGGAFPGIAGNGRDVLTLVNSIVFNSPPSPEIGGFDGELIDVSYTDACQTEGNAFPGTGNICADPKLLNPDTPGVAGIGVRQTAQSPTIDKANDQNFFDRLDEHAATDFEGDPRPVDGDGDGHTTDMGADESPAVAAAQKPQQQTTTAPPPVAPGVVCGRREISLVRADLRRNRVVLTGLVASRFAGRRVTILANYNPGGSRKAVTLGTVTANSAGQFTATVKRPPRSKLIKARFRARVDRFTSPVLKLPQSLSSRSVRQTGSTIEFRGKVKRSVLGRRNTVVVKRLVCGRYRKVGQAKPDRKGNFVVRFTAPPLATSAFYRPETTVLDRPGSRRYVKQYGRAISIQLTAQTG